ncbi:MAG TPA: WD40 repeat domain-containing protein [Hyphomicrobiales bacterium]|nr:WD40 repeat domain-containing protein [Hyphomicrobiales bacterium]
MWGAVLGRHGGALGKWSCRWIIGLGVAALLALTAMVPAIEAAPLATPKLTLERVLNTGSSPGALAWSSDGRLLAISDSLGSRITVWDYKTGTKLRTITKPSAGEWWLSFLPGTTILATASLSAGAAPPNTSFVLVDAADGRVVTDVPGPLPATAPRLSNVARKFALSADGTVAAAITRDGRQDFINFYDARTWKLTSSHKLAGSLISAAIEGLPHSDEFVSLDVGGKLEVWSPKQETPLSVTRVQPCCNEGALAISSDGHFAAVADGPPVYVGPPPPARLRFWATNGWKAVAEGEPAPHPTTGINRSPSARPAAFSPL